MAAPTFTVGEVLTAALVNSWFVPLAAYKTSVTTRSSSTKSIDPDLQFTVVANCIYEIRAAINYTGTPPIAWGWTAPAGFAGAFTLGSNLSGTGESTLSYGWGGTGVAGAVDSGLHLTGMLQVGVTGGTFGFNWASNTGGTNVSVGVGSILTATRVG